MKEKVGYDESKEFQHFYEEFEEYFLPSQMSHFLCHCLEIGKINHLEFNTIAHKIGMGRRLLTSSSDFRKSIDINKEILQCTHRHFTE